MAESRSSYRQSAQPGECITASSIHRERNPPARHQPRQRSLRPRHRLQPGHFPPVQKEGVAGEEHPQGFHFLAQHRLFVIRRRRGKVGEQLVKILAAKGAHATVLVRDPATPDAPPNRVDRIKLASPAGTRLEKGLDGLFRVYGGGALPGAAAPPRARAAARTAPADGLAGADRQPEQASSGRASRSGRARRGRRWARRVQ